MRPALPLAGLWFLAGVFPLGAAPAPDNFAGVPAAVQPFVDRGEIAGAVLLVADQDRVLHLSALGQSDLAAARKMQTGDLFWIASMTKPMTAAGVALLKDEGKLSFDDPVEKFLPEFRNQWMIQPEAAAGAAPSRNPGANDPRTLVRPPRPITLRDLLTHTSGLADFPLPDPHWTLAEASIFSAREPLRFAPGTRWAYSTPGLNVLGRVVEVVGGKPLAEFLRDRLFAPLGMTHTSFWVDAADMPRLAVSYNLSRPSNALTPATIPYLYGAEVSDRQRPPLGGAGLFSTAEDVARFYQMMLHGGSFNGQTILKPETVAEMTKVQTGELQAGFVPGSAWGLGTVVVTQPQGVTAALAPGSFGHGGAYGTQSWADPVRGRIYILMIQRAGLPNSDNSPMRKAFQDAAAAAMP